MPLLPLSPPSTPGLFITGTDTGVGKTVAACLIADQLRRRSLNESPRSRIGVFKPIATGCRREREGLVSDDAEQLAHAAEFDSDIGDLSTVNPVALRPSVAPAVALAAAHDDGAPLDVDAIARSLARLDERCSFIIVEGIGGAMVPLAPASGGGGASGGGSPTGGPFLTTLDLMAAIGYPVVVVCRAGLGTLNHTAMTCGVIRDSGLKVAGLIVNGYEPDSADESVRTSRTFLAAQNRAPVLATLPAWTPDVETKGPQERRVVWNVRAIDPSLRDAIDATDFAALCRSAAPRRPGRSGPGRSRKTG